MVNVRQTPDIPHPTPNSAAPVKSFMSIFPPVGIAHKPPRMGLCFPRKKAYRIIEVGKAPIARKASDGSKAEWMGRSKNVNTLIGSMRLDRESASAKLNPLLK